MSEEEAMRKISVFGAGAWGTALACVMARRGHDTVLWGRDRSLADSINKSGENPRYLPGINLADGLRATDDIVLASKRAEAVLLVTPAQTVGQVAREILPLIAPDVPVILCAKGIDRRTGKLPAQTVQEILPGHEVAALSGPSFASDVARNLPTAVTLAAAESRVAQSLAAMLSGETFRVYASEDLLGVELGGALKNVIAVGVGVCRGLELGASAEAALIARGFAELSRLAGVLGAQPGTLMGLSGLGDLVLTCSSPQSRNFSYGMALGRGENTSGLPLAEGALTAPVAADIARRKGVETPIIDTIVKLIDGKINASEAITLLLSRPLKTERE